MKSNIFYSNSYGDEQWTPRYAVEILLEHIHHLKDKIIWCPFDTEDSWFYKVLTEQGFSVIATHISQGYDFFTHEPERWDVILSNPPYKNKSKYISRAESFGKPWCFLLPINLLSDGVINNTFGDFSELTILVPNRRVRFKNLNNSDIKNNIPTFKASYIGRNFFTKQLIGFNLPNRFPLGDFNASILQP